MDGRRAAAVPLGALQRGLLARRRDAATNDAIRAGGRFEVIVDHLREVLSARRALGADLRVGISMVVGRSAARELPAMGRLAAEIGVDWLKIEEMVPTTPFACHELLAPRAPEVEDGMAALREALKGSPVVLVDHRAPPAGCACEAVTRPELRAFREADDHANRARFNPCRMAWEQAAVDPDGTVHAIDYEHPPLGSLADRSFLDLWIGEAAQLLRADALRRVPRARRMTCPGG
jgi:MoaA/NifB/PqqE/SkfB family radical SAM enzyme